MLHRHLAHMPDWCWCVCSGRKKEVIDEERRDMWEAQQEVLRARREGRSLEGVQQRREEARKAVRFDADAILRSNVQSNIVISL
jgi:hypothetical protein